MSQLFTARKIAEDALKKIGSLSINDDGADPAEMEEALHWLDLEMAFLSGTEPLLWLVPDTIPVPLTGAQKTYKLSTALGANFPVDGIQFPKHAMLDLGNMNEEPVEIIGRLEYDRIARKDQSGSPTRIFIDRLVEPTMTIWPVIGTGVTGLSINLTFQTFAPKFSGNGRRATGLRAAWQRWAIYQVAAGIGDGTVRKLPDREVTTLRAIAESSRSRLAGFENSDHASPPRLTAFRDY